MSGRISEPNGLLASSPTPPEHEPPVERAETATDGDHRAEPGFREIRAVPLDDPRDDKPRCRPDRDQHRSTRLALQGLPPSQVAGVDEAALQIERRRVHCIDRDETLVEAVAAAVAPLQAVIETLSRELSAARATNDALRDQLAAAQSEAAELRGKSAANEAALEREVFDRRALQQQADHIRRERQAAQERVTQVQANIRDEQARLQATEDLVTRLKRELNEVRRTNDRRRWWQWR